MPGGTPIRHLDTGDVGRPGPPPHLVLKSIESLGLPFGHDLHAAVGKISHPAVKALTGGRGADKEPEADALNSAVNQVVSPKAHAGTRRL